MNMTKLERLLGDGVHGAECRLVTDIDGFIEDGAIDEFEAVGATEPQRWRDMITQSMFGFEITQNAQFVHRFCAHRVEGVVEMVGFHAAQQQ